MYIDANLNYTKRDDLSKCTHEYESIWIEISNGKGKNTPCSVFYRHPNSGLDKFNQDLYQAIDLITQENKDCIIMGDFNINLLNFDSHHKAEDFIDTLNSNLFCPLINCPTRITYLLATLIDNIFFSIPLTIVESVAI